MSDQRLDTKVIANAIVVLGEAKNAGLSDDMVRLVNDVRTALIRELDQCNQQAKSKSADNGDGE